jgi:prevent-host-death family protein
MYMSAAPDFRPEPAPEELSAAEVRAHFAAVVGRAEHAGHTTYITHRGRRVAAIVPADVAEYLEELEDERLSKLAAESLADPEPSVPLSEVVREMNL